MPPLASPSSYPRQVGAGEIVAALGVFDELIPIGEQSGSGECWVAVRGKDRRLLKIIVREHEPGRFAREVTALARLNSPRIMRVYEHGALPTSSGSYPYLLSEFVPGGNVREQLALTPQRSDDLVLGFVHEFLLGLAELADARIVHRDLKPENIILRNGKWDSPVIIDLGLSRLLDDSSFTIYPWAIGTWPYMAPEQIRGERATCRSDIWAAAIIASEVASGAHPFRRGEKAMPADWLARLQGGPTVEPSRPQSLRDWIGAGAHFRAYRRPSAAGSLQILGVVS
jgi:eukaryotic-like serine/threonine-protein kinase